MSDQAHFSVFYCYICSLPVVFTAKAKVDDNGKAVHEDCYVRQLTTQEPRQEKPLNAR
jgi:hypothetical protein